jgi:hypothetical protein
VSLPAAALAKRSSMVIGRRFGALLAKRDLNAVLRVSLGRALWAWIDTYLPQRWDRSYVRGLGYTGKGRTPYFRTGTFLRNAVRARPIVRAKAGGAVGLVTVPVGHPLRPGEHAAFRNVPMVEARFVAVAMLRAARSIMREATPAQPTGGARSKARLRMKLSQDMALEAGKYGGRDNPWQTSASRTAWAEGRAEQLQRTRSMGRGHRRGISQGDAAAPGSTEPALGRQATQSAANSRYRHSERGRRVRREQAARARSIDRAAARRAVAANPSRFHPNTRRAYGLAS